MGLHSRSGSGTPSSGADLEAACCWGEGLKLRSSRPSSNDLSSLGATVGWEDRPLFGCKTRSAAALAGAAAALVPGRSPRGGAARLGSMVRRNWRRSLSAALALTLAVVLLFRHRQLYRHGQDAAAKLYYGLDPNMLGRSEVLFPAPHCCRDEACSRGGGGGSTQQQAGRGSTQQGQRVAVVTYLRDDSYLPLLQQLDCTLRRTNPHLELGLMHVEGELAPSTLDLATTLGITLLPVAPLEFPNTYEARYGRNWLKVRALGLTQYDAVLLVDSDVAVVSPGLDAIFSLPVEFAAVWDQSKWLNRWRTVVDHINGGVFLLRPCAAVEAHMVSLLDQYPKLRFVHGTAEQEFFGWYYRYTGATLPLQWNCQAEQCLEGSATVGGARPKIVHFTDHKPFDGPRPGTQGHEFLCSLEQLEQRAQGLMPPQQEQQGEQTEQPGAAVAAPKVLDGAELQAQPSAGAAAPKVLDSAEQQQQQGEAQQPGNGPARDAASDAALGVPVPSTGSLQQQQRGLEEQQPGIVQQGDKELPGRR